MSTGIHRTLGGSRRVKDRLDDRGVAADGPRPEADRPVSARRLELKPEGMPVDRWQRERLA